MGQIELPRAFFGQAFSLPSLAPFAAKLYP